MTKRILVVEDDAAIAAEVCAGLRAEGFDVDHAADGIDAYDRVDAAPYDLVVLDLGLPRMSGTDLLDRWAGALSAPVIVLTARTELETRLKAFGAGAADFIAKPFFMAELVARVRARLHLAPVPSRRVTFGAVAVDLGRETVTVDGVPLELTRQELQVLIYLASRPGDAVTRPRLARFAIPSAKDRSDRVVDTYVARLRQKLGADGAAIATVWGLGYRFDPPDAE